MDKIEIRSNYFGLRMIMVLLFLVLYNSVNAESIDSLKVVTKQRAEVDFRVSDKEKIKELKSQKEFQYVKEEQNLDLNWWQRLLQWLFSRSEDSLEQSSSSSFVKYLAYFVLVIIILFVILALFRVKFRAIFGKQKVKTPEDDINIYSDNVHEMNLDKLVSDAIEAKDYRLAVRYLYLRNLKRLSDAEIILWSSNKTNMSYHNEIKDTELRKSFLQTVLIFDYVWYGELKLNDNEFSIAHAELENFSKMISNER